MKQFFFFGDSIALGVNSPQTNGWVGLLTAALAGRGQLPAPASFYNLGVRKATSLKILGRWQNEFQEREFPSEPSYIVFCFCTVDMAMPQGILNVTIEDSVSTAHKILSAAQEKASVLFLSAPPVRNQEHSRRIGSLMKRYAALCEQLCIPFEDMFTPLSSTEDYINDLTDNVHPGPIGNALIAARLIGNKTVTEWMNE